MRAVSTAIGNTPVRSVSCAAPRASVARTRKVYEPSARGVHITTHCRQVLQRVVEAFGDKVYQTVITKTVKFPESTVAGAPITSLDPASSGARNYRQLAREVIAAREERG